jgi:hypothetical protein
MWDTDLIPVKKVIKHMFKYDVKLDEKNNSILQIRIY